MEFFDIIEFFSSLSIFVDVLTIKIHIIALKNVEISALFYRAILGHLVYLMFDKLIEKFQALKGKNLPERLDILLGQWEEVDWQEFPLGCRVNR